eukprot:TRINITY_DN281_c0_g4_i1.p1 TRINITY_DN281_c0_g4~~TRINITY_DN281_c0_g4_i1.p1  ORF type:complete len:213 (-),score=99.42 TRINITY_DN281_c0_g4_i1:216-854(-)
MKSVFYLVIFSFFSCFYFVNCQFQPIPSTYDGYTKSGNANAKILWEAYFDLECPDSAQSWTTVKKVLTTYNENQLRLIVHLFPLPYHFYAYTTARASVVINQINPSVFWKWIDVIFDNQAQFFNSATQNQTYNEVLDQLADLVESELAINKTTFLNGMHDSSTDSAARLSWKFGAGRSVFGTPIFAVNGVLTQADQTWTTQRWIALFDSLLI